MEPIPYRRPWLSVISLLSAAAFAFAVCSAVSCSRGGRTAPMAPDAGEVAGDVPDGSLGLEAAPAADGSRDEAGVAPRDGEKGIAGDLPSEEAEAMFVSMDIPAEVRARMMGVSYPEGAAVPLEDLRYLRLPYIGFDGRTRVGEMVCNKAIAEDLLSIFRSLYEARYPVRSIRLVDDFGGSDEESMAADNTSCFNYRAVSGGRKLSKHAYGLAVDVNPLENPYVRGTSVKPAAGAPFADRSRAFPHKIDSSDLCCRLFREHGFSWGGNWRSLKDYQHFEK